VASDLGVGAITSQLVVEDLHLRFGGVLAVAGVSLSVQKGEIFAIIGPNGAGKTSLLNTISGLYRPHRGRILFEGQDISRLPPHRVACLGIARSFQNIELFKGMTVLDNLMLGRHVHMKSGVLAGGIYWGAARREEIRNREIVEEIIDFLEIESIRKRVVGTLPYGLQKRVELGRALAMHPRLLLLDEPLAGMNVEEKEDMARFILDINEERGVTIALIEHDMGVVMDISTRVAVLDFGKKLAEGPPAEVRANRDVIKAYLGEETATIRRAEEEAELEAV
jgi:branched-chain amino acid transport system ATP-binding protein